LVGAIQLDKGRLKTTLAGPKYQELFGGPKVRLDLKSGSPKALAQGLRHSPMRYVLLAALDYWATVTDDEAVLLRVLEVARRADPDPWRDQVRDWNTLRNLPRIRQLANDARVQHQTAPILLLLARRLRASGARKEAVDLLRAALLNHPADFWLNY